MHTPAIGVSKDSVVTAATLCLLCSEAVQLQKVHQLPLAHWHALHVQNNGDKVQLLRCINAALQLLKR